MNTDPAVILNIQRQPGANIISVVDRIKKLLPQLQTSLPASVQVKVLTDRTVTIRASVRDVEELAQMGLPIWARWVRVRGATKTAVGEIDVPVLVGGARIHPGDIVVLDADGGAVVEAARVAEVLAAALGREEKERVKRARLAAGDRSYDLDGLRAVVEGPS